MTSLRVLLAMVAKFDLEILQLDAVNAFLSDTIRYILFNFYHTFNLLLSNCLLHLPRGPHFVGKPALLITTISFNVLIVGGQPPEPHRPATAGPR